MNKSLTGVVLDGSGSTAQAAQLVSLPQGESFVLTVNVKKQDGTAFNLTGYSSVLTVRHTRNTAVELIALDNDTITSPSTGVMTFTGIPADTQDAVAADYVFDCWIQEISTENWFRVIPEIDSTGAESIFTLERAITDIDGEPRTFGVSLSSIAITPDSPTPSGGTPVQMTATGTYSDASTLNLTSAATWASATPSVATITSGTTGGVLTAVSSGTSVISATIGTVSGATVATVPAGLSIDFTDKTAADAALVYSRTGGTLWLQTDDHTLVQRAAGSGSLWEDRGEAWGAGVWSLPSFTSLVLGQNDVGGAAWSLASGALAASGDLAPDGATTAKKLTAVSGNSNVVQTINYSGTVHASLWVKDDASSPPTAPGMFIVSASANFGKSLGSGSTWRRVNYGNVLAGAAFPAVWPSGAQPGNSTFEKGGGAATQVITGGATGAVHVFGFQSTKYGDLPLADTSSVASGVGGLALTSGQLSNVIQNGDLDIDVVFQQVYNSTGLSQDGYVWSGASPDGSMALRYVAASNSWILTVKGADVLTAVGGYSPKGTDMRVRAWYRPSTLTCGIQLFNSGALQTGGNSGTSSGYVTGSASPGALANPTSFYFGSNLGTSSGYAARWRSAIARPVSNVFAPELMYVGDSISAFTSDGGLVFWPATSSMIYTIAESRSRAGIVSIARSGNTVAQQQTAFSASPYKASVGYVYIQVGVNDLIANATSAATISALQTLINTVRAANATCKILVGVLTPAKTYLNSLGGAAPNAAANLLLVNTAITNGTITGADRIVSSYYTTLSDGADDPKQVYCHSTNVNLHINENGKAVVAADVRTNLNAVGF